MVIIDSEDGIDFIWIEMIMVKVFWDGWGLGISIVKVIVMVIGGFLGVVVKIVIVFFVIVFK